MRYVAAQLLSFGILGIVPGIVCAQTSDSARTIRVSTIRGALEDGFGLQVSSLEIRSDSVVALTLVEGSAFWHLEPSRLQDSTRQVARWLWDEAESLGPVRVLTVCCHPSSASLPIGAIYKTRPDPPK